MAIIKYTPDGNGNIIESVSNDGGKTFTNTSSGTKTSGNTGTSAQGYSSGNNNYTGNTGKTYNVAGSNGAITVNRPDGTTSTVLPTDSNYAVTLKAMQDDGVNYTPNTTYTNANGTYSAKNYTAGNADLQYALEQAAKNSNTGSVSLNEYVESLYNRIGSNRTDGSTVTLDDVNKELDRLGLSDYNSNNAIFTAGQNLLPGNEFGSIGPDKTGDSGNWYYYGGQQYRLDGDLADYAEYVNGKTGNLNNLSYIFGDVMNNPYVQQDSEFASAYGNAQNQFNSAAGITGNTGVTSTNGSYTGYESVDNVINYVNSLNNYSQATGSTSDLWSQIQQLLQNGLTTQQDFLAQQKTQAEKNAEDLARQAWINSKLQGDSVRESLSAAGLGTSGAMQSAQLGVQSNYNNSLADINSNLNTMISSLSEQELQALIDYTNNLTNYAYQINNDEADRAYQNAQLALQQQEYQNAVQQQAWENAYQQQLLDLQNQQYADETEYARKQDSANYYGQLYNANQLSASDYQKVLKELGLIS